MAVQSRDLRPEGADQQAARRRRRRTGGFIPGGAMGRAVEIAVPLVAILLVVLSVLGTFYGARGQSVPILDPLRMLRDIAAGLGLFAMALCGQLALAVAQWGGRQKAREDRRWWALWALSLALSAWWNWKGYGPPLVGAGLPWLLAVALVVGGDIVPELTLIQED